MGVWTLPPKAVFGMFYDVRKPFWMLVSRFGGFECVCSRAVAWVATMLKQAWSLLSGLKESLQIAFDTEWDVSVIPIFVVNVCTCLWLTPLARDVN